MSEREQFEAALAEKPEVRFWNTTDAMFWAWQAARAQSARAGQALSDAEMGEIVNANWGVGVSQMARAIEQAVRAKCGIVGKEGGNV